MSQLARLLRFWRTLDAPVDRRTYCLYGFSLAAVKYLGDATFIALSTGRFWKPTDYLQPTHSLLWTTFQGAPAWLMPILGIWTLPFLWIGVTLTLRRAIDAGWSPWWTLGFFVPYFNYVLMAALCLTPSSARDAKPSEPIAPGAKRLSSAFLTFASPWQSRSRY